MGLATATAPAVLCRIGRLADPFTWRPPKDGGFKEDDHPAARYEGGRFDDPHGSFSTLYLADSPTLAFVETMHHFRRRPGLRDAILAATDEDVPEAEFDYDVATGVLPRSWAEGRSGQPGRAIGSCRVAGNVTLIDVSAAATHVALNDALADVLARHKLRGFDRGVVQNEDRRITRPVAGYLHDVAADAVGIRFASRFTDGYCVALWHRADVVDRRLAPITHEQPELHAAADILGISLAP